MGGSYGPVIALYTVISICGIAWRINLALNKVLSDGAITEKGIEPVQANHILQLLLESSITVALLANLAINFFILAALFTKKQSSNFWRSNFIEEQQSADKQHLLRRKAI